MPLNLPTDKLPPTTREPKNLFIYGKPKVGKTTICAALPNALHIDTEEGTAFVTTARVQVSSISDLIELTDALPAHWAKHPFRFLVVDVIDTIEDWAEGIATENYCRLPMGKNFRASGGQSVLELDKGAGYRFLREAFKGVVNKLMGNAKWSTIFLGHVRDKYTDSSKTGIKVSEADMDLTGKIKSIMCGRVDAIGYLYRDATGILRMSFETNDQVNCGNRSPYLAGKILSFSTPPRAEDWKQLFPDTWDKVPGAVATAAPVTPVPATVPAAPVTAKPSTPTPTPTPPPSATHNAVATPPTPTPPKPGGAISPVTPGSSPLKS